MGAREEEPIEHRDPDRWWECPACGNELSFQAAHDRYTEGFAPEARPDVWRCFECKYEWVS